MPPHSRVAEIEERVSSPLLYYKPCHHGGVFYKKQKNTQGSEWYSTFCSFFGLWVYIVVATLLAQQLLENYYHRSSSLIIARRIIAKIRHLAACIWVRHYQAKAPPPPISTGTILFGWISPTVYSQQLSLFLIPCYRHLFPHPQIPQPHLFLCFFFHHGNIQ